MIAPLPMRTHLMDARQPADDDVVAQHAMTGQRRIVDHDHPVAHLRVMGDMGAGHEQPVVADPGDAAAAPRCRCSSSRLRGCGRACRSTSRVRSPEYFRSCGTSPMLAKGKIVLSSPTSVQPVTTTWDFNVTRAASVTSGPTVQNGPTVQPGPMRAPCSTTAEGWMTGACVNAHHAGPPMADKIHHRGELGLGGQVSVDGGAAGEFPDLAAGLAAERGQVSIRSTSPGPTLSVAELAGVDAHEIDQAGSCRRDRPETPTITAAVCAIASTIMTPGMTGRAGEMVPGNGGSSWKVTFLTPTRRIGTARCRARDRPAGTGSGAV